MVTYLYQGEDSRKRQVSVSMTDDCKIWLARMCYGEGGRKCSREKASAMMWAMINRFILHPSTPKWVSMARHYKAIQDGDNDFIGMIRMFSQPINPRWAAGGDKAIKFSKTKFATVDRLKRRHNITNKKWEDMPDIITESVCDFVAGKLFPPQCLTSMKRYRISDWASLPSTPKRFPHGVDIDGDWFFENRALVKGCVIVRDTNMSSGSTENFVYDDDEDDEDIISTPLYDARKTFQRN
jgi:hypothetical protein